MYNRTDPKRRTRTAAQVREEAARHIQEDKEKRRAIVEKRRATIGGVPLGGTPDEDKARPATAGPPPPPDEATELDGVEVIETMPGSNKKKPSANKAASQAALDNPTPGTNPVESDDGANNPRGDGIDTNLKGFLLSIKKDLMQATQSSLGQLVKKVEENEQNIKEIKTALVERDKKDGEIETRLTKKMEDAVGGLGGRPSTSTVEKSKREEAFYRCHRSLKLWPISSEDLEDGVKVFLRTKLHFPQSRIDSFGSIEVSAPPAKAAQDRKEVVAIFETSEDRNTIKANGINLANQKECSMSIHVPGHLLDDFFTLNSVGYSIKTNNSGTIKKSVKFDDNSRGIYLDIMIGGHWKRIYPEEARKVLKSCPPSAAKSSRQLSLEDLSNLVQGEAVAGLTAVTVPMDEE